jgi:phosphatidylinositol glycan class F
MVYPAVGAVLGCWAGAFPIPLDWDRPWQVNQMPKLSKVLIINIMSQAWPLTPAFGATLGYIGGAFGAVMVGAIQLK